jgi:hypothetical protein
LAGRLAFDWNAPGLRATLTLPAGRAAPGVFADGFDDAVRAAESRRSV